MKNLNKKVLSVIADTARSNAKREADSACIFLGYQPKMPESVKNLRSRKNG